MQVAHATLRAFETAVAHDQGNSYRGWLQKVLPHISDAYRTDDSPFRSHLGASIIGKQCARAIWYDFRWHTLVKFSGQILRLFNRGHLEEGRVIALLLAAGMQVFQQDEHGRQFRIGLFGGHFGGSGDGVVIGCPDLPAGTACLLEFKTHNDNSFKEVKKLGVKSAKLEHYVQCQTYMRNMGLRFALYIAVNKNSDEIHAEIVQLDDQTALAFQERARQIIFVHIKRPPDKISKSPGWKDCSWCDHKPVCHLKGVPQVNCRTCAHSEPHEDGRWFCNNKDRQMTMLFGPKEGVSIEGENFFLTKERQRSACKMYERNTEAVS